MLQNITSSSKYGFLLILVTRNTCLYHALYDCQIWGVKRVRHGASRGLTYTHPIRRQRSGWDSLARAALPRAPVQYRDNYNVPCRSRTIGRHSRLYSPTCCTRRETRKRPFTWATWCAAVSRFHKRVAALFRVDTAGHCPPTCRRICRLCNANPNNM